MRRYEELTREELADVTDEEVERLVDLEIAVAGIMPVEVPVPPDLMALGFAKTDVAFRVGPLLVRTIDDAVDVAEMQVLKETYDSTTGWSYKWLSPHTDLVVEQVAYYCEADIIRCSTALIDIERRKRCYEEEKRAFDAFLTKTTQIHNLVWAKVADARKFAADVKHAVSVYAKHLDLADNDSVIAEKFFRDAFRERPEIIEAVLGSGVPS